MKNQSQISIGDPTSPGGATYVVQNQKDLFQMAVEFEYLRLYNDDTPITPLLNTRIHDRVKREQLFLNSKLSSLGIPKKLNTLLEIKSKSEVEKYCRNLHFSEFDLFLLIHNCNQINFNHLSRFKEYIPNDRVITENTHKKLHGGNRRLFTKKMVSLLKFRKQSHIHLFERDAEWHLFYFNYSDIEEKGNHHWKGGPHLHYISHLWTHYDKDEILTLFDKRKSEISGYEHIRFVPFEYPHSLQSQEPPITIFGSQPMLLVINSNIPSDPISNPIPMAHVATRGVWITSISLIQNK